MGGTNQANTEFRTGFPIGQSFPEDPTHTAQLTVHSDPVASITTAIAQLTLVKKEDTPTLTSLPSEVLLQILSLASFNPFQYYSISHRFCSVALAQFQERNKTVAQALVQRPETRRLLARFGMVCTKIIETAEATTFLNSANKMVRRINQYFKANFFCKDGLKNSHLLTSPELFESYLQRIEFHLRDVFATNASSSDLILTFSQLIYVPDEVFTLVGLTRLNLCDNNITYVSPNIAKLKNLRSISLCTNEISELPCEIGSLSELEYLEIYNNHLSRLPPEIGKLAKLKELNVSHNKLRELPSQIGDLVNLEYLYMTENNITEFPPTLERLEKLVRLIIDKSLLKSIPSKMQKRIKYIHVPDEKAGWAALDFIVYTS